MRNAYVRHTRRIAGGLMIGTAAVAALLVPAATAVAAPSVVSGTSGPQAVKQFGPYVDEPDCQFDRGGLAFSGAAHWVGPCERHPISGRWWFLADLK
ncbi:hypothetical protein HPO96_03095 [Kribbella sandramycini]|uniref:Secreted protein n=1 Tax=Kribbella sandramycini TaxID=60450 RepID=A0A7Y4KWC3_9ACTN|nr:hypothetical protein [Kribbella sandramycini]MBB6568184.1 hypothetical protein [Kribbella sandramycini]NOL39222.1 hypothetical protein [Kribbella sandramycini]